jgi:hypothetical protein
MQNFQKYFYESSKLFEFRVKIASVDLTPEVVENIKNAIDAYQVETISKPKRLPIQEHKDFGKLGPCECYVIDIAVKYPTVVEQIRQLIIGRAQINADCVRVYTKGQAEQEDAVVERIDGQGPVLETEELESDASGQELVGEKRNISLLKELETRKYEVSGTDKADGKTTNDLPMGDKSPVGSTANKIPTPPKGSVR